MSDVRKYSDDVSQATAIDNVRILAPVPGTEYVGVEIPRTDRKFEKHRTEVMPIGTDIDGKVYNFALADSNTAHMIVAGRTGSGKSQFLKVMIESKPDEVQLAIIDPKRVELNKYKSLCQKDDYGCTPIEAWFMLSNMKDRMDARYQVMEDS